MTPKGFVDRLAVIWGEPQGAAAELVRAEYVDALSQFRGDILDAAYAHVRDTHRYRNWPSIGDCVAAARAASVSPRPRRQAQAENESYAEWTPERVAEADALCRCDLGRQALAEGWLLSLHDYCRKHRCTPPPLAIEGLRASAEFVTAYAASPPEGGALSGALRSLAQSLLRRREEVAARVFGKEGVR